MSEEILYSALELFPDRNRYEIENAISVVEKRIGVSAPIDEKINSLIDYIASELPSGSSASQDWNTIYTQLLEVLPNHDSEYLMVEAKKLVGKDSECLRNFITYALADQTPDEEQSELEMLWNLNGCNIFSINTFVKLFPNLDICKEDYENPLADEDVTADDTQYAVTALYNMYPYIRGKYIDWVFKNKNKDLRACHEILDQLDNSLERPRACKPLQQISNISLLREVAYLKFLRYTNE